MRHIRLRRRYLTVLVILLVTTLVVFAEDRLQAMVPQIAVLAEARLQDILKGGREVSVGSIRGGILRDLELGDIEIKSRAASIPFPTLKIDKINTGFRVWDALLRGRAGQRLSRSNPYIDVKISSGNSWLSGLVRLEGSVDDARVRGALSVFDRKINFNGRGMLTGDKVVVADMTVRDAVVPYGEIDLGGQTFAANMKLNHASIRGADVIGDVSFKGRYWKEALSSGGFSIEADAQIRNLIINQRPFDDIRLSFRIENKVLKIISCEMGRSIKIKGSAALKGPAYPIEMEILADNLNITHTLSSLRAPDIKVISGVMNARVSLKGRAIRPNLKCRLDIRKGNIGDIYFNSLNADLSGIGSAIRIEDSRINTDKGHLAMVGDLDLKDIGRQNIFADVRILTYDRNVVMDGWDIVQEGTGANVAAIKDVSDTVNVGFRTSVNDEKLDPRDRTSQFELGYKMFESDMVNLRLDGESEFVGVEHKEKF